MKPMKLFCLLLVLVFTVAASGDETKKTSELNDSLLQAAVEGDLDKIKSFLTKGADVNAMDRYGLTSLHLAVGTEHKSAVELLLAKGASIDLRDHAGRTALHYSAGASCGTANPQRWTSAIVRLLLDNGAHINAKDKLGWTPLHYAVLMRQKIIVELLINKGADLNATNERGRTAFSLAQLCLSLVRYIEDSQISDPYRERIADARRCYSEIVDLLSRSGGLYYVATGGNDSNPGNFGCPFGTIDAAIDVAEAGDTIFVRGGTYTCSNTVYIDKSGKEGKSIRLWAFPNETPIFDFSEGRGRGFLFRGAYWHLKGLTVKNAEMRGIHIDTCNAHHNVIEQVKAHGNGGTGICLARGAARNLILNCDSYQNFDPGNNGENADGFGVNYGVGAENVFIGCRAWNNSDDGFDFWDAGEAVQVESCYAWRNGENIWDHPFFSGNANGFKLGRGLGRHFLIGCVAWDHSLGGFNLNGNETGVILYSCTAFQNSPNYRFPGQNKGIDNCVLRNNVSAQGKTKDGIGKEAHSQFNSWNAALNINIAGDDFLSLDDSMMIQPRNPDGSIPDSDFLRLAPGSDAIDAGTDVGLHFVGRAPDLGAFEYQPPEAKQIGIKWLHQAVRDHDIEKIKSLLLEGAGVNEKDWLGYAPLHWACYFGYPDLVELLLTKGANLNLISDTGRTPLEIVTEMDYENIAELLNKYGAKE